jgi:hypothetical protein
MHADSSVKLLWQVLHVAEVRLLLYWFVVDEREVCCVCFFFVFFLFFSCLQ